MDTPAQTPTIVFLHIPKTAGQTIHSELERAVGRDAVSPVRVHTQAGPGVAQMPPGYRVYSGHIDWAALETLPEPRFVFTVLRDPLERIASFYFYIRRQAEGLTEAQLKEPGFTGMRMAVARSVDDYFFGGPQTWRRFIRDHYYSPYCSYLATRKIRGFSDVADLPVKELLEQATQAAKGLNGVYTVDGLDRLETDLEKHVGLKVDLTGRMVNADPEAGEEKRWPRLVAMMEDDKTSRRLMKFARADQILMHRLGLGPKPEPLAKAKP